MNALLRSTVALTAKELHHHALALLFVALWSALMMPVAMVAAISNGASSFAAAGAGLAYYYGPVAVLLVVRRLVVEEYEDGTIRFLDALPAPAWLQFVVKYAVGLAASVLLIEGISLPIVAFAAVREYVTVGWFVQVAVAIALYTAGWLSVAFAIAHTGRLRHWIWMTLLVLAVNALDGEWGRWTWHAALAGPLDATRVAIPWGGFGVSALWIVGTAAVAASLAGFRGGALPRALFRGASTRERVTGTALVLALNLVVEVLPETGAGTLGGWERLPERAGVHVAGEVGAWPEATRDVLDALDALAPVEPRTRVILAADHATAWWSPAGPRVRWTDWDREEVLLRVRSEPRVADRARIVDAVLEQRSAGLLELAADRGFVVDGLGLYLVEPADDRRNAETRAALALRLGVVEADLADWPAVRARVGRDLAAGVGAIGLAVVDRAALGPWVAAHLLPVLPESAAGPGRLGRVDDIAGLDPAEHRRRWWAALQRAAAARGEELATIPTWTASVRAAAHPRSNLDVAWEVEGADTDGFELVVRPVDPLRGRPVAADPAGRELVVPLDASTGTAVTWLSADATALARVRVWNAGLAAWVQSPEVEVRR